MCIAASSSIDDIDDLIAYVQAIPYSFIIFCCAEDEYR